MSPSPSRMSGDHWHSIGRCSVSFRSGTHDVLVFERDARRAGSRGGVVHFGFRLVKPVPVATIVRRVRSAGGKILSKGEFAPGLPYVFFEDPDGYEVEVWYETPTPVDPKPARNPRKAA